MFVILDKMCATNDHCKKPNTMCSGDGECVCAIGYVDENGVCVECK